MDDKQTMHAIILDDMYRVERVLAQNPYGVTELVSIDGTGPFVRKKIPLSLARRDVWSALVDCHSSRLPHVIAMYELPDMFVVIYDYVEGQSITHLVKQHGRLSVADALPLIHQVGEAVGDLHAHGIVHRDVTPNNIIVNKNGAHLIDLGIARTPTEHASRDTHVFGTKGFAAPEQYGFSQTDTRSDIYAIGRLLGYLLTGVYPDDKEYDSLLADDAIVPSAIHAVITRACNMEPSARQQSVTELEQELDAAVASAPASADAMRQPSSSSLPLPQYQENVSSKPLKANPQRRSIITAGVVLLVILLVAAAIGGITLVMRGHNVDISRQTATSSVTASPTSPDISPSESSDDNVSRNLLFIKESGWSSDSTGYVHYAIALTNSSKDTQVMYPEITVTGRNKDGTVLFSDQQNLAVIYPNQTVYYGGQAGNGTAPHSVEFTVAQPQSYNLKKATDIPEYKVSGITKTPDDIGGVTYNGEVTVTGGTKDNVGTSMICVSVVLRDDKGRIVGGYDNFVDRPTNSKTVPFSVDVFEPTDHASYEVYAQPW